MQQHSGGGGGHFGTNLKTEIFHSRHIPPTPCERNGLQQQMHRGLGQGPWRRWKTVGPSNKGGPYEAEGRAYCAPASRSTSSWRPVRSAGLCTTDTLRRRRVHRMRYAA